MEITKQLANGYTATYIRHDEFEFSGIEIYQHIYVSSTKFGYRLARKLNKQRKSKPFKGLKMDYPPFHITTPS